MRVRASRSIASPVQALGDLAFAEQRPRASLDPQRPVRATGAGHSREPFEGVGSQVSLAAADGVQDHVGQPPVGKSEILRTFARSLGCEKRLVVAPEASV